MTSRRARMPPGSSTSSVVTQKTGPRYTVREEMIRALGRAVFLDLTSLEERADFGIPTI